MKNVAAAKRNQICSKFTSFQNTQCTCQNATEGQNFCLVGTCERRTRVNGSVSLYRWINLEEPSLDANCESKSSNIHRLSLSVCAYSAGINIWENACILFVWTMLTLAALRICIVSAVRETKRFVLQHCRQCVAQNFSSELFPIILTVDTNDFPLDVRVCRTQSIC